MDYKSKYLKYKNKYLNSKTQNNLSNTFEPIKAIAYFNGEKIKGSVNFEEILEILDILDDQLNSLISSKSQNHQVKIKVKVRVNLKGFEPNTTHGFHVHESGDISSGCDSMCAHFNPYNQTHGGREDKIRHVGDLGNLVADSEGKVQIEFMDTMISLRGDITNIIGRGLIVHENPDDCGKGAFPDSKTTGHSGKRIACAIIGYSSVK